MPTKFAQPQLLVAPEEIVLDRTKFFPPFKVILHNDDHHDMKYVIHAILQSVTSLSTEQAEQIMLIAHREGKAVVVVCPKEVAEFYQERLMSYNLTITIEPD
jgi:ATP-dependent Clp protease adaptor protein ClpS